MTINVENKQSFMFNPPKPNVTMNDKKDIWKFILQTIAAIVTAALAALGTASCIRTF
jgi:hypothetical protein